MPWTRTSILLLTTRALCQPKLEFPSYLKSNVKSYSRVVALKSGARAFIGTVLQQSFYNQSSYHMMFDLTGIGGSVGTFPGPTYGGNGDSGPPDAASDATGNVWWVGYNH